MLRVPIRKAVLDGHVLTLDVTEISQPLPEYGDLRPRVFGVAAASGQIPYAWNFLPILSVGKRCSRQQDGRK